MQRYTTTQVNYVDQSGSVGSESGIYSVCKTADVDVALAAKDAENRRIRKALHTVLAAGLGKLSPDVWNAAQSALEEDNAPSVSGSDTARLDWIEANPDRLFYQSEGRIFFAGCPDGRDLREAIDNAMRTLKPHQGAQP